MADIFCCFREALNCGEVQGPINKEPEEKLDPSAKQQQPSGIRRLYVFDSNNHCVVVVDVKLEDLNCTIADLYNFKQNSFDLRASQFEFTEADDEDVDVDEYFDDGIGEFPPPPPPSHVNNTDTTWYSNLILNALLVSKVFCDTTTQGDTQQTYRQSGDQKTTLTLSESSSSAISSASLSRSSSSEKFEISKEATCSSASILSVASSSSLAPPSTFDSPFNLNYSATSSSYSFARKASSGYASSCSTTPSVSSSFSSSDHTTDCFASLGDRNDLFVKFLLLNLFYLVICLCMNKLLLAVLRVLLRVVWNLFVFCFFALAVALVTFSFMYILRSLRQRPNISLKSTTGGNSQVKHFRSNIFI